MTRVNSFGLVHISKPVNMVMRGLAMRALRAPELPPQVRLLLDDYLGSSYAWECTHG